MLQEPGTRETRHHARELKFLVARDVADDILSWSRTSLSPDPHGSGPAGDEYTTTSVYFDTDRLDVYHRRGSYGRSKYRIRRYGQHDVLFLERKLRMSAMLTKRRTPIALDALRELRAEASRNDSPADWFWRRLDIRRLKPVCQISYQRVARILPTPSGIVRLTIDREICVRRVSAPDFQTADHGVHVLDGGCLIVEMKYIGHPPALFKEIVERLGLDPAPVSKYRLSVDALGLAVSHDVPGAAPLLAAGLAHA